MIGIYKITSPNNRIYIGQSINITSRWYDYKRKPANRQIRLNRSFIKYGIDNHLFEVIEECSVELLNERERYWQDYYEVLINGLNCVLTATNDKSGKISEETRINLSLSKKGNKSSLGRVLSEKTKSIISEKAKGRKHTQESKNKVIKSLIGNSRRKGIKHTQEVKNMMSINRKGKPQCKIAVEKRAERFRKLILDLETGIFYLGVKEASDAKNIKVSTIKARINSKTYNSSLIYV